MRKESRILSLNLKNNQILKVTESLINSGLLGSVDKYYYSVDGFDEIPCDNNNDYLKNDGQFIGVITIKVSAHCCLYFRGGCFYNKNTAKHEFSTDKMCIEVIDNSPNYSVLNSKKITEIFNCITREIASYGGFPSVACVSSGEGVSGDALISALANAGAVQIDKMNQFVREITESFEKRRVEIEYAYSKKISDFEISKKESDEDIRRQREDLENEKKLLDAVSNTIVRRRTAKELINFLRDDMSSIETPKNVKSLRWPIHMVFIAMMLISGLIALMSAYGLPAYQAEDMSMVSVYAIIKSAFSSIAFLTTSALYIAWMNRWFDRHSETQFNANQYQIDINRATWIVEAALEWREKTTDPMPQVLIEGISRNLFNGPKVVDSDKAPLDMLASVIMGSAAQLKMNVNGTQIDFDKKGIDKLKDK